MDTYIFQYLVVRFNLLLDLIFLFNQTLDILHCNHRFIITVFLRHLHGWLLTRDSATARPRGQTRKRVAVLILWGRVKEKKKKIEILIDSLSEMVEQT